MKLKLGFALGLLAGCTVQPLAESPGTHRAGADLSRLCAGNPLRLGVEFLPPDQAVPTPLRPSPTAHVETAPTSPRPAPRPPEYLPYGGRERPERHTWAMTTEELANVRDPIERQTLRFIDDLMGEDRRRLRRDIGTPILTMQAIDPQSPGIDLHAEELQADEENQYLAEHGAELLTRPLQLLLRRTPLVERLEFDLDEFKQDNVPLTEEYALAHDATDLGRVSMRIRATSRDDPIELSYARSGIKVGSSQSHFKVGFMRHLARDVALEVRAQEQYDDRSWHVRADLSWQVSPGTSFHCVAGDNMDFLVTSTVYSLFESPMDGSPGLLVYAVHLF